MLFISRFCGDGDWTREKLLNKRCLGLFVYLTNAMLDQVADAPSEKLDRNDAAFRKCSTDSQDHAICFSCCGMLLRGNAAPGLANISWDTLMARSAKPPSQYEK